MAFVVKYVDNCAENNADVFALCAEDLENDSRVVLVCAKEFAPRYYGTGIKILYNYTELSRCDDSIVLLVAGSRRREAAVECANALYGRECHVYIKNDGLFTADPSTNPFAKRIEKIDYDEVLEICSCGYNAISRDMVELAKKYGVEIHLKSYLLPSGKGTVIKEVLGMGSALVKGVIKEPNICIISLVDIPDIKGISYQIFQAISDAGIVVDIISLPASSYGKQDISFTISKQDKLKAERILKQKQNRLGFTQLVINDNVAKISVVGAALQSSRGVAASVFKILYENDISLRLINTSEIKISVVIDKELSDLAVQKIHEVFID